MNKQERQSQILSHITDVRPDELVSTRELADEFNVSEITMRRDLQDLADEGLIHRQHGGVTLPKVTIPTSQSIGIILVFDYGKFSNPFFNELLEGADTELQHLGYHPAFVKTISEINTTEQILQIVNQYAVKGLLIIGALDNERIHLWKSLVPNMVTTLTLISDHVDTVLFDGIGGIRKMVAHLKDLGHKRIGFIIQHNINSNSDDRLTGYRTGIIECQLDNDPTLLIENQSSFPRTPVKFGREGAERLMALDNPPTAIMGSSDLIALGAMQWLQVNGYRIPNDVAVTGFDNIPDSSLAFPALTTVHVHKSFLGKLAVQQLHRRINNPDDPTIVITTPTSLVIRQST